MYQGKFSSGKANQGNLNEELLAARNSNKRPAAPAQGEPDVIRPKNRVQQEQAAAASRKPVKKTVPTRNEPNFDEDFVEIPEEQPAALKRRRGPSLGTVIFYTLYFLFIGAFVGATFYGLNWLNGWLINYEAAQPTVKCQQVFNTLFTNPDWGMIYDLSGVEDTQYESKDTFVAYMQEKVPDPSKLNFVETSAGTSDDKKYNIRLDQDRIGYFTLRDANHVENNTEIPDWQLGEVKIEVSGNESYRIEKVEGHTAYVNGVALTDDNTIQIATTKAGDYLPVGVTPMSTSVQEIGGLLMQPQVTIKNAAGKEMEVTYDEAKRTFIEATETNTITSDLETLAYSTAKVYGEYMIGANYLGNLANYFSTDSDSYRTLTKLEQWNRSKWSNYQVTEQTITDYCRYSDNIFSARVKMVFKVYLKVGGDMDWTVDSTFFFNKREAGGWICYNMTNENVQQPVGKVRLTFMDGNTKLDSRFVLTDAKELELPVVSAPAGKTFAGWVRQTVSESGAKELTVMFTPDAEGKVTLSAGTNLEPMTLYTYFE